jgi:hypothetical protein
MPRILGTGLVLAALGAVVATPVPAADSPKPPDANVFIHDAIINGLTEDGASLVIVADIAKRDDFVPKCGICEPTRSALKEYAKRDKAAAPKQGRGLSEELLKRLKSDDNSTRRLALRELVQRYIDREYARRELTAEQKTALQSELEMRRKAAMGGLRQGEKFCPSCDGACRLTPKL